MKRSLKSNQTKVKESENIYDFFLMSLLINDGIDTSKW